MAEYTKRHNMNRAYMRLEVWVKGIALSKMVWELVNGAKVDFKLRGQVVDAAHSVPANIAEGYSRRSLKEYMQHIYIALGSLSEVMTRVVALKEMGVVTAEQFEPFDELHYEIENKLWNLLKSLQQKERDGTWNMQVGEDLAGYDIQ
jgi:four helix bundle protein